MIKKNGQSLKKKSLKLTMLVALLITWSVSSSAQIHVYVQIRPPMPVIVMTPQPDPVYVWVNEEWEPYGGSYRYIGGHWALPPQTGYYRRPGYWQPTSKGQRWVPGKWYKKQPANNGRHKGQYKAKHKGKKKAAINSFHEQYNKSLIGNSGGFLYEVPQGRHLTDRLSGDAVKDLI